MRPAVGTLCEHVGRQREIHGFEVQHLTSSSDVTKAVTHDGQFLLNHRDVGHDTGFREQRIQRPASFAMDLVLDSHASGRRHREPPRPPTTFIQSQAAQLVEEIRVVNVCIVRVRANHGAVFLVHFLDFPDILVAFEDVVVCLHPVGRGGEFGAGEFGERVEGDSVDGVEEVVAEFGEGEVED